MFPPVEFNSCSSEKPGPDFGSNVNQSADENTRSKSSYKSEWKKSTPKLRSDLRFFPQRNNGKSIIVIEDPIRSKFFRIGRSEYLFISMLDGKNTVVEAYEKARSKSPTAGNAIDFPLEQAEQICKFLSNAQLTRIADLESIQKKATANEKAKLVSHFNPIFQKLPIAHPTKLLERTQAIGKLLFSIPMLLVWICIVALSGYCLSNQWQEFSAASGGILSGNRWLWLIGVWMIMKAVHEFGHATACHRFGGHVRETGVAFICFFPVAYVDVSSSWRFSNKWHRITVAAAGIYIELLIAAFAAITWCSISDSIVRDLLYNITVVASVTTILFNANPLMKFDGYFVLSDYVESTNLYQKSQTAVLSKMGWLFQGSNSTEPTNLLLLGYGTAIVLWRIAICIGIFIAFSLMGEGIGLVLAIMASAFWIYPMLSKGIRAARKSTEPTQWKRLCVSGAIAASSIACACVFLLAPHRIIAPGVVCFSESQIVRPSVSGFVKELHVIDGQKVSMGDKLVSLRNKAIRNQLAQAKLSYQQAANRIENHRSNQAHRDVASETKMLRKLNADITHYEKQVECLEIYAEIDGYIQMRDSTTLLDSYVKSENEIMLIAQPDQKEIVAAFPQDQFDGLPDVHGKGERRATKLWGNLFLNEVGQLRCQLKRFEPRATLTPPDILLCANVGGSIPVKNVAAQTNIATDPDSNDIQFLSPHVIAKFEIDDWASEQLHAGQRVNVILQAKATSIGYQFYKSALGWLKHKYDSAIDSAN